MMIHLLHAAFVYQAPDGEVEALRDVSLTIADGDIYGIIGMSGAGKSTLLSLMAGLELPDSGQVLFEGTPTGDMALAEYRRRQAAVLYQDFALFPLLPALANIEYPMELCRVEAQEAERQARELARRLVGQLDIVTPGVDTPVRRLSGGNVQKVLVGRELAADPIVLMTAYAVRGLDINTSYTIYHLLNEQKKRGVAVIYVGEDLDVLLELCDRIVVLCGGKVNGILDGRKTTKEEVGLRMTNLVKEEQA